MYSHLTNRKQDMVHHLFEDGISQCQAASIIYIKTGKDMLWKHQQTES